MTRKLIVKLLIAAGAAALSMVPGFGGMAFAVGSQLCNDLSAGTPEYAAAGCGAQQDVGTVAQSVLQVVLGFLGVVAVGVIIYGGFLFLSSSGDAGKVKRGQDAIKYGVIGLIVILLASAIVAVVSGVIGQ